MTDERPSEPPLLPQQRWVRGLALSVLALMLSVFAWWPMLWAYPLTQAGDGPPYHKTLEAARVSIVRYHEFPQWNPYECGGLPLWDNPQAPIGAPLAWPMFFVGTTMAMYLWYVVHSALGFGCMWLFARSELRLSRTSTFFVATAWAFAGFHQQHYSGGHFTFVPFLYFPLALLLWRRAETSATHAVGLGLLVAWMMLEGGVYPIPHLAVILAVETLTRAWNPKRLPKIALAGAIVGAVAFSVAAIRFLPVIDQLRAHKRAIGEETDALQWTTFKQMFLSRTHARAVEGQTYVWPEYGAYLGPIVLLLALIGLAFAGLEFWWMIVLLLFATALMFGHAGKFAPWHVLKGHVFPFKEMRVPSRFRCEVTLFLVAFAGLGVDRSIAWCRRWLPHLTWASSARTAITCVALLGAGDIVSVGVDLYDVSFTNPAADPHVKASPHLYLHGADLAQMIDEPAQNRMRAQCWDEWGFGAGAPLWDGDVPQARAEDDGAIVTSVSRSQNKFFLEVTATRPARILLNGTYDREWRTNVGELVDRDKQLVLQLPEGTHHVVVRYWPHRFNAGAIVSVLGLAGVIAFFVVARKRRGSPDARKSG